MIAVLVVVWGILILLKTDNYVTKLSRRVQLYSSFQLSCEIGTEYSSRDQSSIEWIIFGDAGIRGSRKK
jgi:hypothetical protein